MTQAACRPMLMFSANQKRDLDYFSSILSSSFTSAAAATKHRHWFNESLFQAHHSTLSRVPSSLSKNCVEQAEGF